MNNEIFIPINVPSSKNNKQIVYRGRRAFLINGKLTTRYIKNTASTWKLHKPLFLNMINGLQKPYIIGFHFVRDSKRKWDFINACQTTQDIMTSMGWILDDNLDVMFPVPFQIDGRWYSVDKDKPGVYIKVFSKMELSDIYVPVRHKNGDYVWFGDTPEFKKLVDIDKKKRDLYMTSNEYKKKYGNKTNSPIRSQRGWKRPNG